MRKMRSINFVVVFVLILSAIFSVASASNNGIGQCFGSPPDAKDENGSDGWDLYAPAGYVFTEAMVKAATECFGDGALYQITGIGTDHVTAVRLCDEGPDCSEISHFEGNWEFEEPEEATVSVNPGTCVWDGEESLTSIVVTITGNATVTITGPGGPYVFTSSGSQSVGPGSYSWSAVAGQGYEIEGPSSGQFITDSCEPVIDDVTIVTSSNCINETTMEYKTIVNIPLESKITSGNLWVLWYYPNGKAFVTGPTFLGTVPLVPGENLFTSTMTNAELIAAIGVNNLTGLNSTNDVNYDKLELYTYQVILVQPEVWIYFSNFDYLWEDCGEKEGGCCECPTCGAPVFENSIDTMALGWIGTDPCTKQNCEVWQDNYVPWLIAWTTEVNAASMRMEETNEVVVFDNFPTAMEGVTCTMTMGLDTGIVGDQILWGPEGENDRIRDHLTNPNLNKYSMCSLEPDWCPNTIMVDGVGYFRVLPGTFESRIYAWLMNNGFFPDLEGFEQREAAREWAAMVAKEGGEFIANGWDGDLSTLPLYELPPR